MVGLIWAGPLAQPVWLGLVQPTSKKEVIWAVCRLNKMRGPTRIFGLEPQAQTTHPMWLGQVQH